MYFTSKTNSFILSHCALGRYNFTIENVAKGSRGVSVTELLHY